MWYSFSHKAVFVKHQRIFTGEKSYECNKCGKTYIEKSSVGYTTEITKGRRPTSIMNVEKLSGRSQTLENIRAVTAEKKPCESGKVSFSYHTSQDIRVFTWEKPCECMKFGKIFFFWKSVLIIHQRVHAGKKCYQCN